MAQARGRSRRVGVPQLEMVVVNLEDAVEGVAEDSDEFVEGGMWDVGDAESQLRAAREICDERLRQANQLAEDTPLMFMALRDIPNARVSDIRIVRSAVNGAVPSDDPQYISSLDVAGNLQIPDACDQLHELAWNSDDVDVVEDCKDALENLVALMANFVRASMPSKVRGKTPRDVVNWKKKKSSKKVLAWKPAPSIKERIRAAAKKAPPRRLRLRRVWDF